MRVKKRGENVTLVTFRVSYSSLRLFTAAVQSWFYLPDNVREQFLAIAK